MWLAALLMLLGTIGAGIRGQWVVALVLYVLGGAFWLWRELRRPPLARPLDVGTWTVGNVVFMLLLYPLRMVMACFEYSQAVSSSERYYVGGGLDNLEGGRRFGSWEGAIEYAKKEAEERNESVMIRDKAKVAKQFGKWDFKTWWIMPEGSLGKKPHGFVGGIETDVECPECSSKMLLRKGSTGRFLGCSAYPKCKRTMDAPSDPPRDEGEVI